MTILTQNNLTWNKTVDITALKIKQMLPAALEIATEEDTEFRRGLPLDYLTYMGVQNSDKVTNHLLPVNITGGISVFKIKLCMYCKIGRPKEEKILFTYWDFDEEANNLLSSWCCCGSESQRLPPRLSSSHAHLWCVREAPVWLNILVLTDLNWSLKCGLPPNLILQPNWQAV